MGFVGKVDDGLAFFALRLIRVCCRMAQALLLISCIKTKLRGEFFWLREKSVMQRNNCAVLSLQSIRTIA